MAGRALGCVVTGMFTVVGGVEFWKILGLLGAGDSDPNGESLISTTGSGTPLPMLETKRESSWSSEISFGDGALRS